MPKSVSYLEPMNAVEILRQDHLRLNQLFSDYFAARESRRYDLVPPLCEAVKRHMCLDADIFFPSLSRAVGDERFALRAVAERAAVDEFVEELLHPDPGDYAFSEHVYRLSTVVTRHISASECEEGAFAKAVHSKMDVAHVGYLLRSRQHEWLQHPSTPTV